MSLPDIRHQVAAITLAEELNFTRAAERLGISQPALSKQISELEDRLGLHVFVRDQRRVDLTEAGKAFVRGCKDSHALLEKAVRTARATQENIQPVVTIGHSPYASPTLVGTLLSVHLPLYPTLRLRMESRFTTELVHSLLSSELDIAVLEEPVDNSLLTLVQVGSDPLHAVMSSEHSAADRDSADIQDFGNVGWMLFPKQANPSLYNRFFATARELNIAPVGFTTTLLLKR